MDLALPLRLSGFERVFVEDSFGRCITYYLSQEPSTKARVPLIVYVQGSGCHSLFRMAPDGRVQGRYQNLLLDAARERARVLAVEKPGVSFLDDPQAGGTAEHCSHEFLVEHTLERWSAAVNTAIEHTLASIPLDPQGVLAIGHSEGGIVAARIAAMNKSITHVALVSSNGPTQLFDFVWMAIQRQQSTLQNPSAASSDLDSPEAIYQIFEQIQVDPMSVCKFAWGHPFRRWSSFLRTSTIDEILKSEASVFIVHGTDDQSVPLVSAELTKAELTRHRRKVRSIYLEGADHRLHTALVTDHSLVVKVFRSIMDWFLSEIEESKCTKTP